MSLSLLRYRIFHKIKILLGILHNFVTKYFLIKINKKIYFNPRREYFVWWIIFYDNDSSIQSTLFYTIKTF